MLTGKRFRLNRATLGVETIGDQRIAVEIPALEIVLVLSGPRPDDKRMLDVLWKNRRLVMFVEDVERRGEEITATTDTGSTSA